MEQQIEFCPIADRAIKAASAVQMLTESGYKIIQVRVTEKDAYIGLAMHPKNKKLRAISVGTTYYKSAQHDVYQVVIDGVFVRWLEPKFDAKANAKTH
jgi:hypothetical protein